MDTNEIIRMIKLEKALKEEIKKRKKEIELRKKNYVPYEEIKESIVKGLRLYSKNNKYYCYVEYSTLDFSAWDMEDLRHYQEINKSVYDALLIQL